MFSGCLSSMLMLLKMPFNQCIISKGGKYDAKRHRMLLKAVIRPPWDFSIRC